MIMSIGAYKAESTTSSRKLAVVPMTPPAPRRMRLDSKARTRPTILGISSTTMLNQNKSIINAVSNLGQVGNNWKS